MLAERRDLTVATYSSVRGRGDRLMVWVLTGSGGGAWPCFASVLPHPVETIAREVTKVTRSMTASFFIRAFLKKHSGVKRCGLQRPRFTKNIRTRLCRRVVESSE